MTESIAPLLPYAGPNGEAGAVVGEGVPTMPASEVYDHVAGRHFTSSEGAAVCQGTSLIDIFPSVVRLPVHEPGKQLVVFKPTREGVEAVLEAQGTTMLTAFFDLCALDPDARTLLYPEVPEFYTWQETKEEKKWVRRKRGGFETIGRMHGALVTNSEHFHLRMLLNHVAGPTSYEYLRTVDDALCPTFKAACSRMGLLKDDKEWDECLEEATNFKMPDELIRLFAMILLHCKPTEPMELWERHKAAMTETICSKARIAALNTMAPDAPDLPDPYPLTQELEDEALRVLERILKLQGKSLSDFPPMRVPEPTPEDVEFSGVAAAPARERAAWPVAGQLQKLKENEPRLNVQQAAAYKTILTAVTARANGQRLPKDGNVFFVDGPAGCGKTFLFETVLPAVRSKGLIAIAVASSGIAAQLLPGGTTAHSRLKIPLKVNAATLLNATK